MPVEQGAGVLYLVATPIGNLEDITIRALKVLRRVDLIAAEDTRQSRKLLSRYHLHTRLTSYHEHNQQSKGRQLLSLLQGGLQLALVSDAGMPGISDPGYELVKEALRVGIKVVPVPGASAGLTALVVSGLPPDRFVFEGFLPRTRQQRKHRLEALAAETRTLVIYEAPHRLMTTLEEMEAAWGQRSVAVVRELTKVHEEIVRGNLREVREWFVAHSPRGEITLVVGGATPVTKVLPLEELLIQVNDLVRAGWSKKDAVKKVAQQAGVSRRLVYQASLKEQ